jgi:hypothetical protein
VSVIVIYLARQVVPFFSHDTLSTAWELCSLLERCS